VVKKDFPTVHFYDQDFVDLYDQSWAWAHDFWQKGNQKNGFENRYFNYPENATLNQFESCFASFFLVYSNRIYPPAPQLDSFYKKQEEDGAIRCDYSVEDGQPVLPRENSRGVNPPLFSWAEYNLFHKIGNKKRVRDVMPKLQAYFDWLQRSFQKENGLYSVPLAGTGMPNSPRKGMQYPVDFNAQQALNALYMSELGDILNDKEISFTYKRHYFTLKTRINQQMWNEREGFYFDLDAQENQLTSKTIGGFWPMLAELPNEVKADELVKHVNNPETFGLENPFPTLSADHPEFDEQGGGFKGSVFTPFTFMVIKGLEKYGHFELARECAIRHLYYILDTLHPEGKEKGNIWEAYRPRQDGPSRWRGKQGFPRPLFLTHVGLASIALMIENVIGLYVSLPRKTVDWIIPTLEIMGIENLSLKRNMVTILTNKTPRGWEIRLESEKLYYFTIDILGRKKKTLPIPSGKCSMLIDKL